MSASTNVSITNPRKRGRDEVEKREIDARSFTVKPDPLDPFAAPRTFKPLCLLSRAQLPLAYLDTSSRGSRLFAAHVDLLETADEHNDDAAVLVAAEAKEKKLYAVERVKRRVYALCRLGEWVTEEDVMARSRCVMKFESQRKRQALRAAECGQPWWNSAIVETPDGRRNAMEARLDMKREAAVTEGSGLPIAEDQLPASTEPIAPEAEIDLPAGLPQAPSDVMQHLARQYLEALYISRTSLAYFTKGPLSRARAALARMDSPDASWELISFLQEITLSPTTMDKKFKDGIAEFVKELPINGAASPSLQRKAKRKRKWKSKRDKRGFFTEERDFVERWWKDHDNMHAASSSAETSDQALRRRIPKLRSRETFMQLILILETLALESKLPPPIDGSGTAEATTTSESQTAETQQETQADATEKKSKSKKKQDLLALLETLLDKLCIWHSLETHSPAKQRSADNNDDEDANDELKNFCIEVIIPFYISRIPQHANTVNRKLGGPSAPAPAKRNSVATRKPGEPAVPPPPERKPRKPLSRVATDSGNMRSKEVPALARSATDTDALSSRIKRETSEVPALESIPAAKPQRRPRQSLMHSLNSSHRQVDLDAMSQANDAKLKKKAETQEKMQSAINMLRKPNRTAALEELRYETDESFAKATTIARNKSKSGVQKARSSHSQIAATPSHRRTVKATPYKRAADALQAERLQSNATTHVTSSCNRLQPAHGLVPNSSFAIPQTGHRPRHAAGGSGGGIEETPSRGFAKFMPLGLARQPGTLDSPVASRKVVATLSKPVRTLSLSGVTASASQQPLVEGSPNVQRREVVGEGEMAAGKSIYDALGWDEDEYEEHT